MVPRSAAVCPDARGLVRGTFVQMRRAIPLGALILAALAAAFAPGPASAAAPLPACTYADVLTPNHAPADWQRTLVDTTYRLPRDYVPPDLVPVTRAGLTGNGSVRAFVINDLRALARAASAAGAPVAVQSGYRSYADQIGTFDRWAAVLGHQGALLGSARPGHSEHQLGVAIDFRSAGGSAPWTGDWAMTPAGAWMQSNAWRFGFVMSYPKDASPAKTCYRYEAWHYRYVGRDQAVAFHASGKSLREFLWAQMNGGGSGNDGAAQSSRITAPSALDQGAPAQGTSSTARPATARPAATGGTRSPDLDLASLVPPALTLILATALLITFPVGELGEWRPRGRRTHARRSARQASLYPG
jgi:LAS superfamily LD-carboxypeptidase LdcB